MLNAHVSSRVISVTIVLIGFLCSLLLAAEFDLVGATGPGTGKPQRVELDELITLSGIFSVILAAVAWFGQVAAMNERRARRTVERDANRDPLTGLPNRRLFNQQLGEALARSRSGSEPCALVLIDLDRFKQVNDSWGHATGDALLIEQARRIRRFAASANDCARLGGDEFALILRGNLAAERTAHGLAAALEEALEEPVEIGKQRIWPGASAGLAFAGSHLSRSEDLLAAADREMYRAKQSRKRWKAA